MAIQHFIPTLWSARLLWNLHKSLVYGQIGIINRDWEGEIRQKGDTVKILGIGPVTINDYTKNTDIQDPELIDDNETILQVTQSKYFNFQIDDVDKTQSVPGLMDLAMNESGYGLANQADQFLAGHYTEVAAANLIGDDTTQVVPTKNDAYEYLVDLSVKLDEANIPNEGRWCIVPPWFHALMLKDDRFVKAYTYASNTVLQNGEVGKAAGFTILKSNNVPNVNGAKYKIIAGHPMGLTFAEQINDIEAYRPQKRFADAVKGLHTYGGKLVRPQAWAVLTANKN